MSLKDAISVLWRNSYVSPSEAKLMYKELEKLPNIGRMLELGTGCGHSTSFFSRAKPSWTLYTVDGYGTAGGGPQIYGKEKMGEGIQEAFVFINQNSLKNVIQIICSFEDLPWELEIDALFIDGSHWYNDVKKDWDKFSPFVKKGGIVFFHDYTPSYDIIEFIEKEIIPDKKWKVWNEGGIGFAKRK